LDIQSAIWRINYYNLLEMLELREIVFAMNELNMSESSRGEREWVINGS
jgi:hypothetical protein